VLEDEAIDLIVLDLILPDMDGRSLLTAIRERPETASVPVVVVSARGGAEIRQDCYALGADHFTEKPFDPEEFATDVSARLRRSAGRDRKTLVDPVTGLMNRAGLVAECAAATSDFGIALIQLDGFQSISEKWGWELAETVLATVGEAIRATVAEDARAGRLGSGDFVLYVPHASLDVATLVAEGVLEAIRRLPIEDTEGETFRLTASIGVVSAESDTALDDALDRARRRLFRARESGRNQVVSDDGDVENTKGIGGGGRRDLRYDSPSPPPEGGARSRSLQQRARGLRGRARGHTGARDSRYQDARHGRIRGPGAIASDPIVCERAHHPAHLDGERGRRRARIPVGRRRLYPEAVLSRRALGTRMETPAAGALGVRRLIATMPELPARLCLG